MDLAGALMLLLLSSPLLFLIAVAIKADSRGPILYRQRRLGRYGREFWCYKFRTMVADAERQLAQRHDLQQRFASDWKIKDDPRVTPLGRFLRKASLDELPQLFNVLCGDMSLIGPRPIVQAETSKYGTLAPVLLSVKPGLGGMWQVSGRSNTTYEERVALDVTYVRRRTMLLDIELFWRTAVCVVTRKGAC